MIKGKEKSYLSVRVQTRARECRVVRVGPFEYRISVVSLPSKGMANKEVVQILASYFDLAPSQVSIISGTRSPRKRILIKMKERVVSGHGRDKKSG